MTTFSNPGLIWRPAPLPFADRLERILEEWRGTKYMSGQQCKGTAADCIGFVFGEVDELYGRPSPDRTVLPPDTAMHSPEKARATMRKLRRLYSPNSVVTDRYIEPGDVIVVGPHGGGPGHIMSVGPRKNTLWHCSNQTGVVQVGLSFSNEYQQIFGIYRFDDREKWVR